MRKLLVVPCLMVLLAACADSQTQEESLLEESSLSTRESALCGGGVNYCWVCGFSNCGGTDYAPYNYGCVDGGNPSGPCGACTTNGVNATQCGKTTGSLYDACGIDNELRVGYYVSRHASDPYCDAVYPSSGGTVSNKTVYGKIPGADQPFTACGINACPGGYSLLGYSQKSDCAVPASTSKNATMCTQLSTGSTWRSWNVCGSGCPSGWYSRPTTNPAFYSDGCAPPGNTSNSPNTTTCFSSP